ncbi:MoaD/ThiS family protein [Tersicoccus sp. Bi-70]|uniref:MoaD/ThiS family protein n=1 Tax=Tersicoccus sp. Bi-70 TaxID=1897634 RepID=UPI0018E93A03|nr:MoaD/ThiS family protein [Tersicoccus sp. Bi-70]
MQINYYAGAAAAAGTTAETVDTAGLTFGQLKQRLAAAHPAVPGQPVLHDVLTRSSFLLDGLAVRDDARVLDGAGALDVLPPFAGG